MVFLENLSSDCPDADIILRSQDSREVRVPKFYIVNSSSPVLAELLQVASHLSIPTPSDVGESHSLIQLTHDYIVLVSLLTYIFPVSPLFRRQYIKSWNSFRWLKHLTFFRDETASLIYSLAQIYGLHQEALRAARTTLSFSITIEDIKSDGDLDIMSGASLYELWRYLREASVIVVDISQIIVERFFRLNQVFYSLEEQIPEVTPSSDSVNAKVDKSVLVMSSPFFSDMLSLPQPPDHEVIDGPPVIPETYDGILSLLAASEKYDMDVVSSSIRAHISCGGLLQLTGAKAFPLWPTSTSPLPGPSNINIRQDYLSGLERHIDNTDCVSCMRIHALKGETFLVELQNQLAQALDVIHILDDDSDQDSESESESTPEDPEDP
ncbi:hypothetical protein B0F90DRAFT_1923198 [Multifurca ochricompacta]|uniref:Uncharacterized protein n=1 Tax=Multifurca ochricompacta TaxID=376703 RepID=A0AAD4MAM2_9AGAM|nr:hypothetical protein B0F90DRAFT_1923198 [Multifurca ochricompacta]